MMRGAFKEHRPINRSSGGGWFNSVTLLPEIEAKTPLRLHSAKDCLDIGTDLGSTASPDNDEKAPFDFGGRIENVHVQYIK
jgi:hypothetical protein